MPDKQTSLVMKPEAPLQSIKTLAKIATVLKKPPGYFLDEQRGRVSHLSQDGNKRKQPFEGSPRILHDEVVRELS